MKCSRILLAGCILALTACNPSPEQIYAQANTLFAKGDFAGARPLYEELLVRDPNNLNAYTKLAVVYSHLKQWSQCVQYAHQAIDLKAEIYEVYYHGSFCHARLNQQKQALDLLETALKKFPDRKDLKEEAAFLYFQQKNNVKASKLFKELSDQEKSHTDYAFSAGTTFEAAGQLDQAENYYRRTLENDPKNANASYGLGSVFEKRGENEIAMGYYEKAIKLRPDHLSALLNLAQLQEKSQPKAALVTWKNYLNLARQKNQSQNFIKQAEQRIKALGGG